MLVVRTGGYLAVAVCGARGPPSSRVGGRPWGPVREPHPDGVVGGTGEEGRGGKQASLYLRIHLENRPIRKLTSPRAVPFKYSYEFYNFA